MGTPPQGIMKDLILYQEQLAKLEAAEQVGLSGKSTSMLLVFRGLGGFIGIRTFGRFQRFRVVGDFVCFTPHRPSFSFWWKTSKIVLRDLPNPQARSFCKVGKPAAVVVSWIYSNPNRSIIDR